MTLVKEEVCENELNVSVLKQFVIALLRSVPDPWWGPISVSPVAAADAEAAKQARQLVARQLGKAGNRTEHKAGKK